MKSPARRRHPVRLGCALFAGIVWWLPLAGGATASDLSGSWTGSWVSQTTGHSGPMRAEFTRCGDSQYRVDFAGRFMKILPFRYSVTLDVVEAHGDCITLAGSSYLGRMFGTFTYQASADACRFTANYCSKKDRGQFQMSRVTRR